MEAGRGDKRVHSRGDQEHVPRSLRHTVGSVAGADRGHGHRGRALQLWSVRAGHQTERGRSEPAAVALRRGLRGGERAAGSLAPLRAAGCGRRGGVLGVLLFLGGLGLLLHEIAAIPGEDALRLFLLTSALMWAAACWRWGSPLFAGLSRSPQSSCCSRKCRSDAFSGSWWALCWPASPRSVSTTGRWHRHTGVPRWSCCWLRWRPPTLRSTS